MSWLVFAFSGPVLWGISFHLDKYLVERYFKDTDVAVLVLFTAFVGIAMLPFIWFYRPGAVALPLLVILPMGFSGVLYLSAMLFYLRALQTEDVSVVAPLFQASPLFAAALAYAVLGETLSAAQLLGGVFIIGGALLLSWRGDGRNALLKTRLLVLMLICTFALAVASVIFKIFALREEFWIATFWTYAGEAVFGLALLAVGPYRRQFLALLRTSRTPLLAINGANELINLGGGVGVRYALTLAPVGLVQAIGSTTTLFVFLIGIVLSVFFPGPGRENLWRRDLARKGAAALLVAAGVMLVNR